MKRDENQTVEYKEAWHGKYPNLLYGFTDEQLVAAVDNSEYGVTNDAAQADKTHHDTNHDTHHDDLVVDARVSKVLHALKDAPLSMSNLLRSMNLRDRATLREVYLRPCFKLGYVELTLPGARQSRSQQYRLTELGAMVAKTALAAKEVSPKKSMQSTTSDRETGRETDRETDRETSLTGTAKDIYQALVEDPGIMLPELAVKTGLSVSGVRYQMRNLGKTMGLHHEGSTKAGRWVFAGKVGAK